MTSDDPSPRPTTLTQGFLDACDRFKSKRAVLRHKVDDGWVNISHEQLSQQVSLAAAGLRHLGLQPSARIGIVSHNRPEWAVADFASLALGSANVPIYPTLPADQTAYVLNDAGVEALFLSDIEQYRKIESVRFRLPALKHIITFERGISGDGVSSLEQLYERGRAAGISHTDHRQEALRVKPDDVATLIYTSGTTGSPKGVMLTHRNIAANVTGALDVLPLGVDDSCLSLLPLSHAFERTCGHYTMIFAGVTINYAESIDAVPQNLQDVRPTVLVSVPRLFEKMYGRVLEAAMAGGAVKRRIFFWARQTAETWADFVLRKETVPTLVGLKKRLADRLVFSQLQARTGGRIRYFVSGGAPLSPEIARFFYAAGLPILEGYGLTESAPVISVNPFDAPRIGSVGRALPNVEITIAPDGEVLARGPNIMQGYYNRPDATAEAIDRDGWLHTGDIGKLDDDGYLTITDRKKDIIVTAGGKNIAPQPIENMVKANPFILNAVMIGDRRKFPSILVVPSIEALGQWAKDRNLAIEPGALLQQSDVVTKIETEVMGSLRDLANFEKPKKVLVIERDFSVEAGELTPTLKVKRRVVEERYRDRIDALYDD